MISNIYNTSGDDPMVPISSCKERPNIVDGVLVYIFPLTHIKILRMDNEIYTYVKC